MTAEREKIERLIVMGERLIAAVEADIAALKAGKPQQLKTLDPEIMRLSALYGREAQGFDPKTAPQDLRGKLFATTGRFRDALNLYKRLLTRLRQASEGLIKAVAEEVDRRKAPLRSYAPGARQRPISGAMIYNSVV